MQKKYLLIILIVAVTFIGGMYFLNKKEAAVTGTATGTKKTGISALFPFLGSNGIQTPIEQSPNTEQTPTAETPLPTPIESGNISLKKLSNKMVAGFIPLPATTTESLSSVHSANDTAPNTETLPLVRFAEIGTGYIYDVNTAGKNERKISGTLIARTALAHFANGGKTVAMQYIKENNTTVGSFLGTLAAPTGNSSVGTLMGSFLQDGIANIAVSPDGKNFLYLTTNENGSVAMTMKADGSGKKQLFQSAFSEWLLEWRTGGIAVTTKAAATIPGYAYMVSGTGTFTKIIGSVPGLTTLLSPDGKTLLYGIGEKDSMELHIRRLKDGKDTNTGLATLPEKCTWSSDNKTLYCGVPLYIRGAAYPDTWYQGQQEFTDAIWKIDSTTGVTTKITAGSEGLIDATHLKLDPTKSYLCFINKNDLSLWALKL